MDVKGEIMNYETVELKTNRLLLKKGSIDDFLKVYEYDYSLLKHIDGIFELKKQDLSKIKSWFNNDITKYYKKIKKSHMFDWLIYLDDSAIGNILTKDENIENKEIELSFNLHPTYWKNGFMKEALEVVIKYLFSIGFERIICGYHDGNIRAKNVINKLGFKPYRLKKDALKTKKGNLIDQYDMILVKNNSL